MQILTTINLAIWIGVAILFWLGLFLPSWNNLSIAFLFPFSFLLIEFAYMHLYQLPPKKRVPHKRDDSKIPRGEMTW